MSSTEIYDKAKYHQEGDYPKDISPDQAFVHTGYFVGWAADHYLLSSEIEEQFRRQLTAFRRRQTSGPQLYAAFGGVLEHRLGIRRAVDAGRFVQGPLAFPFQRGEPGDCQDRIGIGHGDSQT